MYLCNSCLLPLSICLSVCLSSFLEILGPRNTFWRSYTPSCTLNSESNICITLPSGKYVLYEFIIDRMLMTESLFCKMRLLNKTKPKHSSETTLREVAIFCTTWTYSGRNVDQLPHQNVGIIPSWNKIFSG